MQVTRITDVNHEGIDDYRNLTDVALRRVSEPAGGLYIAESPKVIQRAIDAGHRPRSFLVLEKWLSTVLPLAEGTDATIYVGEDELLHSLTGFSLHRGALASMQRPVLPRMEDLLESATRVVVLEDIVDHTNVGAIFRAAAGLGADAVLVSPRCADPLYRRSVRVSMGTVLQVPWTRIPEWPEASRILRDQGFHIAALALSPDAVDLDVFAADAPARLALVMGAEGDGLSQAAMVASDTVVRIPMLAGVDSLNVAAASAVALWALRPPR